MTISTFFHHILRPVQSGRMTVKECAAFCLSVGIEGIDVMPCVPMSEPVEVLQLFLNEGMKVCSMPAHWDILHDADGKTSDTILETADRLGVGNILLVPGYFEEGEDREKAREKSLAPLSSFCRKADSMGIAVSFENFDHVDSPVFSTDGLLYYLTRIPELCCTFDTGNAYFSGEDVWESFCRLRPYVRHQVHCKDRVAPASGTWTPGMPRPVPDTVIGDGAVPIAPVLSELHRSGFDGVITLEHFDAEDPVAALTRAADFVKKAWAEACDIRTEKTYRKDQSQ